MLSMAACGASDADTLPTSVQSVSDANSAILSSAMASSAVASVEQDGALMDEAEFKEMCKTLLADILMQLQDYDINNPVDGDGIDVDFNGYMDDTLSHYRQGTIGFASNSYEDVSYRNWGVQIVNCDAEEIQDATDKFIAIKSFTNEAVGNVDNFVYCVFAMNEEIMTNIESIVISHLTVSSS